MELEQEVTKVAISTNWIDDLQLHELNDLQLAFVGGGSVTVIVG